MPKDDRDGELPREQVIATLRKHGLIAADLPGGGVLIGDDEDILEVQYFPAYVHRSHISSLSRKFGIHIVEFYGLPPPHEGH